VTFHRSLALTARRICLPLLAAAALPASAHAAEVTAPGVVIPSDSLKVGVSGAPTTAGAVNAHFAGTQKPLFKGADTTTTNDGTAARFALNTARDGLFSSAPSGVDNVPFTQTMAPTLTGNGTAVTPWIVESRFDAGPKVHVVQKVTHINDSLQFTVSYAITNADSTSMRMAASVSGDIDVYNNPTGESVLISVSPDRVLGASMPDGTAAWLDEDQSSPWDFSYEGTPQPVYDITGDSGANDFDDSIFLPGQAHDAAVGVEWGLDVPAGGTVTRSVDWVFAAPPGAQAPTLTGAPANGSTTPATSYTPTFAAQPGDSAIALSFACEYDGGAWQACTSGTPVTGLTPGFHSFAVHALNSAGIAGADAVTNFFVGSPPNAPGLTTTPPARTNQTAVSIPFTLGNGETATCSFDNGAYTPCTSPFTRTGLPDGPHSLSVKATNASNLTSTAATTNWTIDTGVPTPPGLLAGPPALTTATNINVAFSSEAQATIACSLDGAAFTACTSPFTATGLQDGAHTLLIKQTDQAGNASAARNLTWTIDTTAPTATFTAKPATQSKDSSPAIAFTQESGATSTCSLDGASYGPCSSPFNTGQLADGFHTFRVMQTDAAGNTGAAAGFDWTIDTTVPPAPVTISQPPSTTATTATVTFSGDPSLPYQCSLDNSPYETCTSPVAVAGLSVGAHKLEVRQVSASGVASSVLSTSWTVKQPETTSDAPTGTAPTAGVSSVTPKGPCTSRRALNVHWKLPKGAKGKAIAITIDGKTVSTLKAGTKNAIVSLVGRPKGTLKVQIKTAGKTVLLTQRTYHTCVPRQK